MTIDMRDPFGIVGTILDRRYEIRRVVAEGGFAVVYEAEAITMTVRVAVKVLKLELHSAAPRFAQEAKLLARLRHPAIVELLDASTLDDGTPFLVLTWLDGETLDEALSKRGPMGLSDVVRLFGPVVSALNFAHHEGVIHRDLKPANLMMTTQGAKVLDFGVARWDSTQGVQTTTTQNAGLSIGYAAPEQYGKELGVIDERTDQFSLAAIMFSALSGLPAFQGETPAAVMFATCTSAERPSLRTVRKDLPMGISVVIERALAIKQSERFPTIDAFWNAFLDAASSQLSPSLKAPPTEHKPEPPTKPKVVQLSAATMPSPVIAAERGSSPSASTTSPVTVADSPKPMTQVTGTVRTGDEVPSALKRRSIPPESAKKKGSLLPWLIGGLLVGGAVASSWLVYNKLTEVPSSAKNLSKQGQSASLNPHGKSTSKAKTDSAHSNSAAVTAIGEQTACGVVINKDEVCIEGGKFKRGPADCSLATADPCPPQSSSIRAFWMDRHEVTIAKYRTCVQAKVCEALSESLHHDKPSMPVRHVSWVSAKSYCEHAGRRLPRDDEWELAASGFEKRAYPWGNTQPDLSRAVFSTRKESRQAPDLVGNHPEGATLSGVHDLAGNVAEWTSTIVESNVPWPYGVKESDYEGESRRWVRGGAYNSRQEDVRTWVREGYPESIRDPSIGFRCVRDAK